MNDNSVISAVNEEGRAFDLSLLQKATYVANYLPVFEQGLWRKYSIGNKVYTHETVQEYVESEAGMNCTSYSAFRDAVDAVATSTDPRMAEARSEAVKLLNCLDQPTSSHGGDRGNQYTKPTAAEGVCQADIIRLPKHGTSKEHLRRRIARDYGQQVVESASNEGKSTYATAVELGIKKRGVQIGAKTPAWRAADNLLERLGEEWCAELITVLTDKLTNS